MKVIFFLLLVLVAVATAYPGPHPVADPQQPATTGWGGNGQGGHTGWGGGGHGEHGLRDYEQQEVAHDDHADLGNQDDIDEQCGSR